MEILGTPDERFANLPGYAFAPHYADVDGLRIHYVDEGPRDAAPVVMPHGEPSWSYLYRKMIPIVTAAGHRVVAANTLLPAAVCAAYDAPFEATFHEIAGAVGQPHAKIAGGGHFLQEDRGEELARVVVDFLARTA